MSETTQPPAPSAVAQNSGTLGAGGNGLYGAWYQGNGAGSWYITNDIVITNGFVGAGSQALWCQSVQYPGSGAGARPSTNYPGQYVVVPQRANGAYNPALTIVPPFSIETWIQFNSTNSADRAIISEGQVPVTCGTGTNLFQGWAGFALGEYQDYLYFMCLCTNGTSKATELDTSGYNKYQGFKTGQIVHVVATFDGTTEAIYTNGVLCASKTVGANAAGLTYVPDTTSPIVIGAGSVMPITSGNVPFSGLLGEVAIYTNVLSTTDMANHIAAATTSSGYAAAVQANNPLLYYRFSDGVSAGSSAYTPGSYPVANNYGSIGTVANGVYQPGTTPGVAGPTYAGFGANSKAVAFNGTFGTVNIGNGALPLQLNPSNYTSMSVAAWFKAAPADSPGRVQEMVGHSDNSYRLVLGTTVGEPHWNPGPWPSAEVQFDNATDVVTNGCLVNDGNWHMVVGTSDGTNEYMYVDGRLVKSKVVSGGINVVGSVNDMVIGGDPQYTYVNATSPTIRNFDGSVAHVAFFTNVLSQAQVQQLYGAAGVPPTIVQEPPATLTLNAGSALSVPVIASGSSLSYQWYKNGSSLSSQTTATLSLNPLKLSDAGTYYVHISNSYGNTNSTTMALTVNGPPVVTNQSPADIKVFVGTHPVLHASAYGPQPISYQWTMGGTPIAGATTSAYSPSTASTGSTVYNCTITNSYGSAPLNNITVQVIPAPTTPYPVQVLGDSPASYFRLDEAEQGNGDAGVTAYDYAGGCNAYYTNTTLGNPGYSANTDPTETSANFGYYFTPDSFAGNGSIYANFATPAGNNAQLSVEAWINASYVPSTDAGIVAVGYGYGGEQFTLDCGGQASGTRALRFYVVDAAGTTHGITANSTTNIWGDTKWHHVVGVCDEAGGKVTLWVDGQLQNTAVISAGAGLQGETSPLCIGSRRYNSATTTYGNQFQGYINDVALYSTALSSNQIVNHYLAAGIAPTFVQNPPASVTANQGDTVTLSASVLGTAPVSYQWQVNYANIPGATTTTLVLNNVDPSMNGYLYTLTANNAYGGPVTSSGTILTVNSGVPSLTADISPLHSTNYAGNSFTYSVQVSGSQPFNYQWYQNGAAISGATSSNYTFTVLSNLNSYYVHVSNSYGATNSSTATLLGIAIPTINSNAFSYKAKITFAGYTAGEVLSDFPALVVLTNIPGFAYNQLASPNGGDLRFTDASGTRALPYEIDDWNPAGNSTVWVQVPHLATTNDFIMAYWGNAADTTPQTWSTNGGVWVPQPFEGLPAYNVVYHLKEGAAPYLDSTTLHTATNAQVPTATAPGLVGTAASFTGANFLDAGVDNFGDAFTLSAWLNIPNGTSDIQGVWMEMHGGYGAPGYGLWVNTYQHSDQIIEFGAGGTSGAEIHGPAFPFGAWHQLQAAVNRTNGTVSMYVDGANVGQYSGVPKDFYQTNNVYLGMFNNSAFGFHGGIDEARIQSGNSSANWIWADYMTMAHNSTFQSYGPALSSKVYITAHVSGGNLVLSWPAGTLWAAPTLNGPWHSVTSTSPYTVPMTGPAQFFRLQ